MTLYVSEYKGTPSRAASYVGLILNFLLLMFSAAMVGVGVWMIVQDILGTLRAVLPSDVFWDYTAYGMVVVGVVAFVTCILAIVGFMKEIRQVLIVYCVLTVLVMMGLALFCSLPLWYRNQVTTDLYTNMEESIRSYTGETANDADSVFWNYVQTRYDCCGIDNEQDYKYIAWNYETTLSNISIPTLGYVHRRFPASCCSYYSQNPPSIASLTEPSWTPSPVKMVDCYGLNPRPNPPYSHEAGCYSRVRGSIRVNMLLMGCIACGLEVVCVLLLLISCFVIAANTPKEY